MEHTVAQKAQLSIAPNDNFQIHQEASHDVQQVEKLYPGSRNSSSKKLLSCTSKDLQRSESGLTLAVTLEM